MLSEYILVPLLSSYKRLRQDGFYWTPVFLDKESQKKLGSLILLESGGHDAERPRSQQEPFGYLPQVGEHRFSNLHKKTLRTEYRLHVILLKKRFIFEPRERNSWDNIIGTYWYSRELTWWLDWKKAASSRGGNESLSNLMCLHSKIWNPIWSFLLSPGSLIWARDTITEQIGWVWVEQQLIAGSLIMKKNCKINRREIKESWCFLCHKMIYLMANPLNLS